MMKRLHEYLPLNLQLMILDRNHKTGENNDNDTFEKVAEKLMEEFQELIEALESKNRTCIAEEAFDLEQVLQRVFILLHKEKDDLEQLNIRHNQKLIRRGWTEKGIIKYRILKRK